jgi:hypothetical protein
MIIAFLIPWGCLALNMFQQHCFATPQAHVLSAIQGPRRGRQADQPEKAVLPKQAAQQSRLPRAATIRQNTPVGAHGPDNFVLVEFSL